MDQPLVSIITINYNNKKGLLKTVQSVLSQNDNAFEYIVIDGGSSDGSTEVIDTYKNKFSYSVSEKDAGIYEAMNKGIKAANGKYLLFLNSGDYLANEEVLKKAKTYLKDEDIVFGNLYQDVKGRLVETIYPSKVTEKLFFKNSIPHPASFIKKELFYKLGFYNTTYKLVSDWEFFFLAVSKHKCTVKHMPLFVSVYDLNGLSRTQTILAGKERAIVMDTHFKDLLPKYNFTINVERKLLWPYRIFKKGVRYIQKKVFNIYRVYVTDL